MRSDPFGLRPAGRVATGPLVGLGALVLLLAGLTPLTDLSARGCVVGLACGIVTFALVARSMARHARRALSPADRVTLTRAVLTCGAAALVAGGTEEPRATALLVVMSSVAIALDGVDGRIARRTGTASSFGARLDMEVDALLILVLSADVAVTVGWWVLLLGLARYLFLAAGLLLPWLRATPPPRDWAKAVAVIVAVVLVTAASGILPEAVTVAALAVALVLLVESFAHSVWALWRMRGGEPFPRAGVVAALALLLVWVTLLLPDQLETISAWSFLSIPVEGLVFVAVVLALPPRAARAAAVAGGLVLAVLTLARMLDIGFQVAFDSPFHVVYDSGYAGPTFGLLVDSVGRTGAWAATLALGVLVLGLVVLLPWAALTVTRLADRHRRPTVGALCCLSAVALVTAASGARLTPEAPAVSTVAAHEAYAQVSQVREDLRDRRSFARAMDQQDHSAAVPTASLLSRLRGKDVLLVFVESYGRVALDSPVVRSALSDGQRRLAAAGLTAHSGWLTSPTFGGKSWLAHSTLQSGLWVDNQQRFDRLMTSDRLTLSEAFHEAGWHTVVVAPEVSGAWPEATSFYHYDQVVTQQELGYAGPTFSWAAMPDQYSLAAFQRLVLDAPDRGPVMAQVQLVSSHWPWTPLPRLVGWDQLGDGSIFDPMADEGPSPATVTGDPQLVRAAYARSIAYSMDALTRFLPRLDDPNLVVVVLGDHQPSTLVSGENAGRDVPISIIANDPTVTDAATAWGWAPGLRPQDGAPVWPMDAFRDQLVTTFSTGPAVQPARTSTP